MRAFATLFAQLDASTSTRLKIEAMRRYFEAAEPADAAWAVYFLAGGRPRRLVGTPVLRTAVLAETGLPEWLFEESYQSVGDLAETIALLLSDSGVPSDEGLATWLTARLLPLRGQPPALQAERVRERWRELDSQGRFLMNKLITGGLRVGVSRQLVLRALAAAFGRDERDLARRIIGYTAPDAQPDAQGFRELVGSGPQGGIDQAHPYPFFLAQPLQQPPDSLGPLADWLVEWKWDGIRAQLVKRGGTVSLWSRGEELITDRFPEVEAAAAGLPEPLVLDGELLCWAPQSPAPLPFAVLQTRIGRRSVSARLLREAPARFVAYDLLEDAAGDLRGLGTAARLAKLDVLATQWRDPALARSDPLRADDWAAMAAWRAQSRSRGVEGLMLKRAQAPYGVGRTRSHPLGDWWKWKIDPWSVDAVLIYAQRGHGRRASLYTDYTFAVWDGPPGTERRLVPFAKAYSGLADDEIRAVDAVIRRTTIDKFGPVRSVTPTLVFELGFEGIARSSRHKCGVAVRFPRMLRLRADKPVDEADQLSSLIALIDAAAPAAVPRGDLPADPP